jgi:signal transduction histidine kinase/CheY-like chemotaxis protein
VSPLASVAPQLVARARADQVATLYARWHLTSLSMGFGALLLCAIMWDQVAPTTMAVWLALIAVNQTWRAVLARAWRQMRPGAAAAARWGRYWVVGSVLAGALWGVAGWVAFPGSPQTEALLIVCLFGVVLGGLNLTAVYRPSFYGFVLPALVPLIVRVAWVGDTVHTYTACVMSIVLAFVLGFGHRLNDVLTQSLAIRYENVDLIGELRERTRAAQEAQVAAEAANRAKSQLLAAASHDLRQPLHALGLYVAALAARARDTDWRALVGSVQAAAETLDLQFAQLLDLSRLEAGALTPERAPVPLAPLLASLATEFAPQAAAHGLSFTVVRTRLAVDSDPALLSRIARNLVANAVRYTREGGIVIGARRRGPRIALEVFDTGIGIGAEHRARIFEEFYQVRGNRAIRGAVGGMGLGLAIVRRLADLLRHDIELSSRIGHGSRFAVIAPRAEAPPPRPWRPRGASVSEARVDCLAFAGRVVAVIDDDPATVDAMRLLFETWGAVVAGGVDVDALLAACGELGRYPDLIVADLRLSDEACGVDVVAHLRDEFGALIPALVISGDTGSAASRRVRDAGLALLPKPVVASALEAAALALLSPIDALAAS